MVEAQVQNIGGRFSQSRAFSSVFEDLLPSLTRVQVMLYQDATSGLVGPPFLDWCDHRKWVDTMPRVRLRGAHALYTIVSSTSCRCFTPYLIRSPFGTPTPWSGVTTREWVGTMPRVRLGGAYARNIIGSSTSCRCLTPYFIRYPFGRPTPWSGVTIANGWGQSPDSLVWFNEVQMLDQSLR
jgi:hypothetical protein